MNIKRKYFYFFSLLMVFLLSCERESIIDYEEVTTTSPLRVTLNTNISGYIKTEKGAPISGASIKINTVGTTTDIKGYFSMKNVLIDSLGEILFIDSPGYKLTFVKISPVLNEVVNVEVILHNSEKINYTSNTTKESFSSGNIVLELSPQSIIYKNGEIPGRAVALEITEFGLGNENSDFPSNLSAFIEGEFAEILPQYGFYFKVVDEQSLKMSNKDSSIWCSFGKEVNDLFDSGLKLVSYNTSMKRWNSVSSLVKQGQLFKFNTDVNTLYFVCQNREVLSSKITFKAQNELVSNFKIQVLNRTNKLTAQKTTNNNGEINVYGKTGDLIEFQYVNLCGQIIPIGNITINNNDQNKSLEVPALVAIDYSVADCYGTIVNDLADVLEFNIESEKKNYLYFSNKTQGKIFVSPCEIQGLITLKDALNTYIDTSINIQNISQLNFSKIYPKTCSFSGGAQIVFDNKAYNYDVSKFYIFSEPAGSDNITITDFQNFFITTSKIVSNGKYKPESVTLFINNIPIECNQNCDEVELEVLKFGRKNELMIISMSGKLGGKKIEAYFKNYRMN